MENFNGSRQQAVMGRNRVTEPMRSEMCYPVRGKILPNGVRFKDHNGAQQTLVDVFLFDYYPIVSNVPIARNKINMQNGEEWTPEPGDLVLVQFISGNFKDPIITGYLAPAGNEIETDTTGAPRFSRRMSGTSEVIDKSGNRVIHVAKDETVEIIGNGTVTIGGKLTITAAEIILDGYTKTTNHLEVATGQNTVVYAGGKALIFKNGILVGAD